MAIPSSPVPRTKLLVAVRLFPTLLLLETLLRLIPSAHMSVNRLLDTLPPVPAPQIPEVLCWAHIPVTTQLVPETSMEPPEPSTVARLCALESRWKFSRVLDTARKAADRPLAFGRGTER